MIMMQCKRALFSLLIITAATFVTRLHGNVGLFNIKHRHQESLDDFSLSSPAEINEKWITFGNVSLVHGGIGGIMIGGSSGKQASMHVGSIWSKKALSANVVLSKDFSWELKATVLTHNTPSADHEHGFGMWIVTGETLFPESQWSVSSNNLTGMGVFVAEYGDFADSSSQIVDVCGVVGREVALNAWPDVDEEDETPFQNFRRDRAHCSINSWDVHQRETRLIARKEGVVITVRFSSCDDFELDLSNLIEANNQQKIRSKFHIGISFWTNQRANDAIQVKNFELSRISKGHLQWHDDDENAEEEVDAFYQAQLPRQDIFNFPHREITFEVLSLSFPYKRQLFNYWKMYGVATAVALSEERQIVRLTGISVPGAGALISQRPLERRLLDSFSSWRMEVVFRVSSKNERIFSGGFAVWISSEKPILLDANNQTSFSWNSTFTGFAIVIEAVKTTKDKPKQVHVQTIIGRDLDLQWGDGSSNINRGVKCVLPETQLPTSSYVVSLRKLGGSVYASFANCLLVFDLSSFLPQSTVPNIKDVPLLRAGVGAWSTDIFNYRDLRSIAFSEVIKVAASSPVFAHEDGNTTNIKYTESEREIELDCELNWVYPKPGVTWKKMDAGNEQLMLDVEDQQILVIQTDQLAERYTCIASNTLGNVTRTFIISKHQVVSGKEKAELRLWMSVGSFALGFVIVISTTTILYCTYRCRLLKLGDRSPVNDGRHGSIASTNKSITTESNYANKYPTSKKSSRVSEHLLQNIAAAGKTAEVIGATSYYFHKGQRNNSAV